MGRNENPGETRTAPKLQQQDAVPEGERRYRNSSPGSCGVSGGDLREQPGCIQPHTGAVPVTAPSAQYPPGSAQLGSARLTCMAAARGPSRCGSARLDLTELRSARPGAGA